MVEVRIDAGRVVEVAAGSATRSGRAASDEVFDAAGGALLPGLHDHHIHLLALAAAARSVRVGPSDVGGAEGFARALRAADAALEPGRWMRAVGTTSRWRVRSTGMTSMRSFPAGRYGFSTEAERCGW